MRSLYVLFKPRCVVRAGCDMSLLATCTMRLLCSGAARRSQANAPTESRTPGQHQVDRGGSRDGQSAPLEPAQRRVSRPRRSTAYLARAWQLAGQVCLENRARAGCPDRARAALHSPGAHAGRARPRAPPAGVNAAAAALSAMACTGLSGRVMVPCARAAERDGLGTWFQARNK
jgi:hypothetical protein